MTTIYLIRHGQASFGEKSYDKLSAKGEEQSTVLGQFLQETLKEQPLIVAGSMQRHQQTASISLKECFSQAEVHTNADWNEFNHQQIFERLDPKFADTALLKQQLMQSTDPYKFLMQTFGEAVARWTSNQYQDYDESWTEFQQRIERALSDLCQQVATTNPRYVLVYTSGGVISVLVGKLLGLSLEKTFELTWAVVNTSLTALKIVDGEPKLLSFNEHHYLKAKDEALLSWV